MDSVRASERSPDVLTDIAGDPLCLGCAAINNTNINNTAFSIHRRILQIFWTGAKYAVTDNLDLTRRLLSLQSRQLWRRRLLDRRQIDVQRDARRSFFRGRLEICGEVRCLRRVHVLASRQWAGERLPQSQHDRSDGRGSLPILRNPRAHVPDHATRSRRRGDRMKGLDGLPPLVSGAARGCRASRGHARTLTAFRTAAVRSGTTAGLWLSR